MMPETVLPALRPVELLPIEESAGEPRLLVHDPVQLGPHPLAVSFAGALILPYLDGRHTVADAEAGFLRQTGQTLPRPALGALLAALDAALLLDNERAALARAERRVVYAAAPTRDSRDRDPEASELRAVLAAILSTGTAEPVAHLRGLITPHLDYRRGAPCYADAYATLATAGLAERYVILGTNHCGESAAVVATEKDFETALGRVTTDRTFLANLERRVGTSLRTCESDHASEHSIELQVHWLQHLHGSRPFEIVPLLCPDPCGPTGTKPADGHGPDLAVVAAALGELRADDRRYTVLIAGADLSHVGQRFGDQEPTTAAFLAEVAHRDRELLNLLCGGPAEDFRTALAATENPTRICSAGCLYVLRHALPASDMRILRYHQAVDYEAETHVTCAAGILT
ncbi:MAG: AmmeMemoRadiSam system protein B [Phycisphaerales bacterium]|nr:AmmeMemoRadiSam system protein B [Phycisphaerales bacterium]